MIVESVISARSLWFGDMRQLNPRGRNLIKVIIPLAEKWFGFAPPQEPFDERKGVRFVGGEFSPSGRNDDLTGVEVTLYENGLVATSTTDTKDTDLFIEQILLRLAKEGVAVYRPEMFKKKLYASEIVARAERELLIPILEKVCDALTQYVYSGTARFSPTGLMFDADQSTPAKQIPFKFERRAGASFSENLYYSQGPLTTEQHKVVLNALEDALSVPEKIS